MIPERPPAYAGEPREPDGAPLPPWGVRECLIGLGLALAALATLLVLASVVTAATALQANSTRGELLSLALTLLFEAAMLGIALSLTTGKWGGAMARLGWRAAPPVRWIGYSAMAVVLAWITLIVYQVIAAALGLSSLQPKSNVPTDLFKHAITLWPAIVLTVLIAPLCEESFFRGFLFGGLRRRLGFAGAASVSGVLFAVAHASAGLIIPFTVIGVIFAYVYLRSGTLWASATAHFTFNLVSVIVTLATLGRS